ncbi:hypothetical protein NDU88_001256 [Pleurodeles waltl]|uniref:Uncharacterized protein n=1 Tax=Pleurodeles waltl TaxID=8319 RepID=A0AAV7WM50_PLEWA|nr:hypothetical protein NDU88_001256 [Pleurodeles waltl]
MCILGGTVQARPCPLGSQQAFDVKCYIPLGSEAGLRLSANKIPTESSFNLPQGEPGTSAGVRLGREVLSINSLTSVVYYYVPPPPVPLELVRSKVDRVVTEAHDGMLRSCEGKRLYEDGAGETEIKAHS